MQSNMHSCGTSCDYNYKLRAPTPPPTPSPTPWPTPAHGALRSASDLFDWNGCKTSDTSCECGMPGISPEGVATILPIDEAFCQTMIDAGNATSWVSDGTCRGKCTGVGIGCYGTNGVKSC